MSEKLDAEVINELIGEADDKWFSANAGKWAYGQHRRFVAEYITNHYHERKKRHDRKISASNRGNPSNKSNPSRQGTLVR